MTNLEHLSKAELIDLLNAYDAYIIAAADSGRLKTGWVPVCVSEFFSCEYQDVWRVGQNFDYMYEYDEHEVSSSEKALLLFEDAEIFFENGTYLCRFVGETEKRIIRDNIRDIKDGDAFFIPSGLRLPLLRQACGDSHQNFDEKDEPWIVYDVADDGWFQEAIGNPSACIKAILLSQKEQEFRKPTLDNVIQTAEETASGRSGGPSKPRSQERQ